MAEVLMFPFWLIWWLTSHDFWEPLEYVGETLVFFGVVGEVCAEWKWVLKKKDHARETLGKLSSVTLIVGLALSLAALIGTNEHFNGTIADLNFKSSQANERASKNDAETTKQRLRADKDEKDLLKLQKSTLPRTLDPDRVVAKISGYSRISTAVCVAPELEPEQTFSLIRSALDKAHWTVPDVPSSSALANFDTDLGQMHAPGVWIEVSPMALTGPGPRSGLIIKHSAAERARELKRLNGAADALVTALNSEGVDAKKRPLTSSPDPGMGHCPNMPDAIRILVGLRPMPDMPDLSATK